MNASKQCEGGCSGQERYNAHELVEDRALEIRTARGLDLQTLVELAKLDVVTVALRDMLHLRELLAPQDADFAIDLDKPGCCVACPHSGPA